MEFSEIITSFFDIIVTSLLVLITCLILYFIMVKEGDNFLSKSMDRFMNFIQRKIRYKFVQLFVVLLIVFLTSIPLLIFFGFILAVLTPQNGNFVLGGDLPFFIFIPVKLNDYSDTLEILASQVKTNGSGDFASLANTNGFIELDNDNFEKGQKVPFYSWKI